MDQERDTLTRVASPRLASCEAVTAQGTPCQAPPLMDGRFCFHHEPGRARERSEARRRGGRAAHGLDREVVPPAVRLEAVGDVLRLLETAAGDILLQKPSLSRARALAYLSVSALRALEVGALEERLAALEAGWSGGHDA